MAVGYIKLYRKISESFVWTNSDMFKLWCLCLMKASHENRKFLFNGQEVHLSSGQFVTGRDAIAKEFNQGVTSDQLIVSRTLWRWLKRFEKEGMLSISSTPKYSVITINNWNQYQANDQQLSSDCPSSVQQLSTNKNDKNDKNDKNNNIMSKKSKKRIYSDDDPNKKLAKLLFKLISKNQSIQDPDFDKWANTIRLTIEADKRTGKEVQEMIVWSSQSDFWSSVILSPTSLRKHFDKMSAQKSKKSASSTKAKTTVAPSETNSEVNY
nr:MAG TPA: replisome organizer [Caudoviricetes sp.]